MASPRRTDNDQDFADHTILWFEKLFPVGAIVSAIFAGFTPIMPGAGYYTQRKFAAVGSLLFTINVLLCAACTLASTYYRPQLKAKLRAGGFGKVVISAMSLSVQLLFLAGLMFFFLVMNMVQLAQGIVGMVFTGLVMFGVICVWVAQLRNSDKGIRLTEEE